MVLSLNRRLTLLLSLIFASILLLSACGVSDSTGGDSEKAEGDTETIRDITEEDVADFESWTQVIKEKFEGTELNLGFATHPSTEAFQRMTDEFEERTGIKLNWEVIEQTHLKNKQLLDFTGKTGSYDVIMVDNFWNSEYVAKGVVEPLDDYLNDPILTPEWFDYEDIIPAYREGFSKVDGETYGIPIAGETRFLSYRTDLFEKYGKEPPETMDELLELAEFFDGKEPGLSGISMRAERGIHFGSGWMTILYAFSDGFIDQETGEITMNDSGTVKALQFYVDLLKHAPDDVATYTHEEALSAYMAGKAAMWIDSTAIAPQIIDPEKSSVHDKVAFLPSPEGPAGTPGALAGFTMGIPVHAKNKEAAWAFIVYMNSKPMSEEYIEQGGVLGRASQFENPNIVEDDILYPAVLEALQEANELVERGISWVPPHENVNQMLERIGYYGSLLLHDEITLEEAAEESQKELEEIAAE